MEPDKLIYAYFKAKSYRSSENALKSELKNLLKNETGQLTNLNICLPAMTDLFKSIYDTNQESLYFKSFHALKNWVAGCAEFYQNDLRKVLGPIFIFMYLSMIKREMQDSAPSFFAEFCDCHWNQKEVEILKKITGPQDNFGIFQGKYLVSMEKYSFSQLIHYVETQNFVIVLSIINKNLEIDIKNTNSATVLLGKDLKIYNSKSSLSTDEEKAKKDLKVPVSLLNNVINQRKFQSQDKVELSESALPDIISFTIRNASEALCIDISEDSLSLACGFEDSLVRVFDLTSHSEGVDLVGHSGAVYCVNFSPDSTLLISGSEDSCVRLWLLDTFSCLVVYKAHSFPIWTLKFAPFGHYFLSAGLDKICYLWATEHSKPLRMFVGHYSDIFSVHFHPKLNYVLTGSSDKSIRLWDVLSAECLKIFIGHFHPVTHCIFTRNGKNIVSGDDFGDIIYWNIVTKEKIWHLQLIGSVNYISNCYDDHMTIVATDKKEVYLIAQGKVLAGYKTKIECFYAGFSYKNLGVVGGIMRIQN